MDSEIISLTNQVKLVGGGITSEGLPPKLLFPTSGAVREAAIKTDLPAYALRRGFAGSFGPFCLADYLGKNGKRAQDKVKQQLDGAIKHVGEKLQINRIRDWSSLLSHGAVGGEEVFSIRSPGITGEIVREPWSTPIVGICVQIERLKKLFHKVSGQTLGAAIYGFNVRRYLQKNVHLQTDPEFAVANWEMSSGMPFELLGLRWYPAMTTSWWGPNDVSFMPRPAYNTTWFTMVEIEMDSHRTGKYAFLEQTGWDSFELHYGDNFALGVDPKSVMVLSVAK